MAEPIAGTVVCDNEGRIRAFDAPAQEVFGYRPEEVIGRKRLQALAAGPVAIGLLPGWIAAARQQGSLQTVTALRGRDGRPFAAQLILTALADGIQGQARPLPEVALEQAMPSAGVGRSLRTWLAIARAPFLTATLAPVVFAGAWAWATGRASPFPWAAFLSALVAALLLQSAANMLNDYFDWTSGADLLNNDHLAPFSGGSRAIELGLLSPRGMLAAGLTALSGAAAIGLGLAAWRGWGLLLFGLAGAFAAWFYTAPPLRLVARKGLGELTVGLCFGPLMVAGAVFALTGRLEPQAFLAGAPLGLLTADILWINEIPDTPADAAAGKTHLVGALGARGAAIGYAAILALAFLAIAAAVALRTFTPWTLVALLAGPLAVRAAGIALAHHSDRSLVRANAATIQLHLLVGTLLSAGVILGRVI